MGKWNLPTDIKVALHNHLWRQQKGLCIYCQQQIHQKTEGKGEHLPQSIIEHIRPRDKYPELTYILCNLSFACKKYKANEVDIDFCEDKKSNGYDEDKFLNPNTLPNIEDYFDYDLEGRIWSRGDDERAKYMIEKALNLNHQALRNMRKSQYELYLSMDSEMVDEILLDNDAEQLPAFYSMLKHFWLGR